MVDMTSVSSERGFPFSAYISNFLAAAGRLKLTFDRPYRFRAAPTGFVRRKYFGAALLVLCAVYAGGLLLLYTPFFHSGTANRFTAVSYRNLLARPITQSAILVRPLIQTAVAAIPEIHLVTLDLQKIDEADRSLGKTGRVLGTAALRKATDHVLKQGPNARVAVQALRTTPSLQDIGRPAGSQVMVAMYLKVPKDGSASGIKSQSFGDSQRVINPDDASNLAFAKNNAGSCGGFAAGRQSSDFAHGVKGTNSSFGHRSSGISVPELAWKWCAL